MVTQGYVEAAQMFEGESGTRPGVDLNAITERMHIRKAVQSGNIEAAIEAANDLDPQVAAATCQNT
jgi:glucose-induced degradation protein 8